ncbi:MAG TPA: undecaprenyldiphospho-muramoylpentapeptide beta-N-acetylglucosaminyltransferase [Acidimicrobiales bacterium]|nr:undecaprenyldiphospho-muramoylpentapeptide beta-N-acetylglucosaminyltransferase [Acidimicrobiales bacterium]
MILAGRSLDTPTPPGASGRRGTWAVVAGGGTAGHVLPAIAIGRALVVRGHPSSSIHFVGSRRGIEGRLVADAGFSVTVLPGRGVARRLTFDNVAAVAGLVAAAVRAVVLLARMRPSVVISVGGYASVPCVIAAAVLRVPLVVAEQNAVPGSANRLAARLARAAAVSFEGTKLPRAVLTGNPLRREVLAVDRTPAGRSVARAALGLPPDAKVVAAFGGSLGALRINRAVLGLAHDWNARGGLAVRHIVGRRDWDEISSAAPRPVEGGLVYQQVGYEDRMDLLYAAADVAVCRAGATTVAELAAVGLPAILVPLAGAPGDHQTANALALQAAGAARLVPDGELTAARLEAELDGVLADADRLAEMGRAGRRIARPGAADAVAALAEECARG